MDMLKSMREKKIKDFSKAETADISDMLTKYKFYLGIKQLIKSDDIIKMVDFIVRNFPFTSLLDMDIAIQLYASGKLTNLKLPDQINPLFIGSLLNSYFAVKRVRVNEMLEEIERAYNIYMANLKQSYTVDQKWDIFKSFIRSEYESFVEKKQQPLYTSKVFDELVYFDLIKLDYDALSKEADEKVRELVQEHFRAGNKIAQGKGVVQTETRSREEVTKMYYKYFFCNKFFETIQNLNSYLLEIEDQIKTNPKF